MAADTFVPDKLKVQTEIDFLASLEGGQVASQVSLARRLSVSAGLMNALVKRAAQKGYVKVKAVPYRRYAYYLTPKGFAEKRRLVAKYLETSLDFFREARQQYVLEFLSAQKAGFRSAAFVGQGELAEIALIAARDTGFKIIGIYDRSATTNQLHGLPVLRDWADCDSIDVIVVTDSQRPQEVFDQQTQFWADSRILTPPLLRILREIPNSVNAVAAGRDGRYFE